LQKSTALTQTQNSFICVVKTDIITTDAGNVKKIFIQECYRKIIMDHKIELKLRIATSNDFIELSHYKADRKSKVFKLRIGQPFWCINSKGVIEQKNYCTKEGMDKVQFKILLMHEQILVCDIEDGLIKT